MRKTGVVALLGCAAIFGQQYTVETFAGAPEQRLPVAAEKAAITISSAAADFAGTLYIASGTSIYKVGDDGMLRRIAGGGTRGFSGDGGPAISAQLGFAAGLSVDAAGNLYFCDIQNQRVRKISTDGVVTTVAGGGEGGDGGPAVNAKVTLSNVPSTAVDSVGNRYFTEFSEGTLVRKITAAGIISTALKSTVHADQIAVDGRGNLYLADRSARRVYIVPPDQSIRTFAGTGATPAAGDGGSAVQAAIAPVAVAADGSGNVFLMDALPVAVRKVSPDGTISTVPGYAGDPPPGACFQGQNTIPIGISTDGAGSIYAVELLQVRRISTSGAVQTIAGNNSVRLTGDGGPASAATFSSPWGVALDGRGNVYISDAGNSTVRKVGADGLISTLMGDGAVRHRCDAVPSDKDPMISPMGVAVDGAGNVFVASDENRVHRIGADGAVSVVAGNGFPSLPPSSLALQTGLNEPHGVAIDNRGNLYIANTWHHRIELAPGDGSIRTIAGGTAGYSGDDGPALNAAFYAPTGLALDAAGNLFIADTGNHAIRKIATDGTVSTVAGSGKAGYSGDGGPATQARLYGPQGVAVDSAGNLYISDTENGAVRKVTTDGTISTIADGQRHPFGLAVDAAGNVYVANSGDAAVLVLRPR